MIGFGRNKSIELLKLGFQIELHEDNASRQHLTVIAGFVVTAHVYCEEEVFEFRNLLSDL